jgi:hypothetical protein
LSDLTSQIPVLLYLVVQILVFFLSGQPVSRFVGSGQLDSRFFGSGLSDSRFAALASQIRFLPVLVRQIGDLSDLASLI